MPDAANRGREAEAYTGWAIARPQGSNAVLVPLSFAWTRSGAWAAYLGHSNSPQARRRHRDRGFRAVRVIVHQLGHAGCNA